MYKKYYLCIFIILFLLGYFCYYLYRGQYNEHKWQEEILLSNGDIITIDRKATFYGQSVDNLTVTLNIPKKLEKTPTPTQFSTNELTLLLDYSLNDNYWYIVTTFAKFPQEITCPVYKLYKYDNHEWYEIDFDPNLHGRKTNLVGHIMGDGQLITVENMANINSKLEKSIKNHEENDLIKRRPNLFFYNYFHHAKITKNCFSPE